MRLPVLALTAVILALLAAPAGAAVVATKSADRIARAIVTKAQVLRDARWVTRPPRGNFAAVSSTPLVGFPRDGETFAVLSSGSATAITRPNSSDSRSHDNRGRIFRGTRDAVVLRIDFDAPSSARCLSVVFRFLSEEYDEFVGSDFNDGFLVELDRNSWRSEVGDPRISAPHNFAFDRQKRRITVNSTGDFSVTEQRARNTTYDAGTRRLRASRPITPGRHSLYLSIFDQGDRQYDSSVVVDRVAVNQRNPCVSGAALD